MHCKSSTLIHTTEYIDSFENFNFVGLKLKNINLILVKMFCGNVKILKCCGSL
jgi:hypothetical protein